MRRAKRNRVGRRSRSILPLLFRYDGKIINGHVEAHGNKTISVLGKLGNFP